MTQGGLVKLLEIFWERPACGRGVFGAVNTFVDCDDLGTEAWVYRGHFEGYCEGGRATLGRVSLRAKRGEVGRRDEVIAGERQLFLGWSELADMQVWAEDAGGRKSFHGFMLRHDQTETFHSSPKFSRNKKNYLE